MPGVGETDEETSREGIVAIVRFALEHGRELLRVADRDERRDIRIATSSMLDGSVICEHSSRMATASVKSFMASFPHEAVVTPTTRHLLSARARASAVPACAGAEFALQHRFPRPSSRRCQIAQKFPGVIRALPAKRAAARAQHRFLSAISGLTLTPRRGDV